MPFSDQDFPVNIFVGNLAFTATDQDLRQLFEPYGAVDKINLITDRDTGRAKGFGFVEMPDRLTAGSAIQGLHGKDLQGRALRSMKPNRANHAASRAGPAGKYPVVFQGA